MLASNGQTFVFLSESGLFFRGAVAKVRGRASHAPFSIVSAYNRNSSEQIPGTSSVTVLLECRTRSQ